MTGVNKNKILLFQNGEKHFYPLKNNETYYNMFGKNIILKPQFIENTLRCSGNFRTPYILSGHPLFVSSLYTFFEKWKYKSLFFASNLFDDTRPTHKCVYSINTHS